MEDQVLKALYDACQQMEAREDKNKISAVERMRPQQMLYNYLMTQIGEHPSYPASEKEIKNQNH